MMKNIKAILGGISAIIVMGLLAQLFFLFIGVAYFSLVKKFPLLSFLAETSTLLLFFITAVIAFVGGMLTANLAKKAAVFNCLAVGVTVGVLTLLPSLLNNYKITANGFVFLIIFPLATVVGGLYWKKKHQDDSTDSFSAPNPHQ